MFKVSWSPKSDQHSRRFVIVPDAKTAIDIWWVITGYSREDGLFPVDVKLTNLDGDEIDVLKGLAFVASQGTYSKS